MNTPSTERVVSGSPQNGGVRFHAPVDLRCQNPCTSTTTCFVNDRSWWTSYVGVDVLVHVVVDGFFDTVLEARLNGRTFSSHATMGCG